MGEDRDVYMEEKEQQVGEVIKQFKQELTKVLGLVNATSTARERKSKDEMQQLAIALRNASGCLHVAENQKLEEFNYVNNDGYKNYLRCAERRPISDKTEYDANGRAHGWCEVCWVHYQYTDPYQQYHRSLVEVAASVMPSASYRKQLEAACPDPTEEMTVRMQVADVVAMGRAVDEVRSQGRSIHEVLDELEAPNADEVIDRIRALHIRDVSIGLQAVDHFKRIMRRRDNPSPQMASDAELNALQVIHRLLDEHGVPKSDANGVLMGAKDRLTQVMQRIPQSSAPWEAPSFRTFTNSRPDSQSKSVTPILSAEGEMGRTSRLG